MHHAVLARPEFRYGRPDGEKSLLRTILDDLHVTPDGPSKKGLVDALHRFLLEARAAGRNVVLLIDEAQDLSAEVLEQIRLISNLETDTEKLIAAMEGMSFETPKGKMTFRKEDHQAMQDMYHFKIKVDPAFAWGVPELVREIKASEMDVPIRNSR